MADQWYFEWADKKFGPFSAAQLQELAGLGRLQPTDTVWKEGTEKGVLAAKVNHLFPEPKTKAIPAKAIVAVFSSELQPTQRPSSSLPGPGAKLDPRLPLASDQDIPDGLMLVPDDNDSAPPVSRVPIKERNLKTSPALTNARATAVSGAVIIGQDGENVRYRKKCSKCGHTGCTNTMPIRNEVTRANFFCPKCRKLRDVVIEGTTN